VIIVEEEVVGLLRMSWRKIEGGGSLKARKSRTSKCALGLVERMPPTRRKPGHRLATAKRLPKGALVEMDLPKVYRNSKGR
jgi:hypothetical protein